MIKAPTKSMEAIVFDCDGTLTHIEGIDELARWQGVGEEVAQLTAEAMGRSGINPELYRYRLELVKPTLQQMQELGECYFQNRAPQLLEVIHILQRLGKALYIISAGLTPAIHFFAQHLGISDQHIYAVDITFDHQGVYENFAAQSPLIHPHGKCVVMQEIAHKHPTILFVGDGLSDLEAKGEVTRFVGYGGAFPRENIKRASDCYIEKPSMAGLLACALTQEEVLKLTSAEHEIYQQGLRDLQ